MMALSGGCQCGRVRFDAEADGFDAELCHCTMCRKATGGFAMASISVLKATRRWMAAEPDWYNSSPIARRAFCSRCGSPLAFEYFDNERCDMLIGCLDDPSPFLPTNHFGAESIIPAWLDTTQLPQTRCADHAPLVEKWRKAALTQLRHGG